MVKPEIVKPLNSGIIFIGNTFLKLAKQKSMAVHVLALTMSKCTINASLSQSKHFLS